MVCLIIGVIVGYAIWTALWLGGNAVLFGEIGAAVAEGEAMMEPGPYVGVLVLSVVCSLAAGLSCAASAGKRATCAVIVMSVLLLVTGIFVQLSAWELMPVWYHIAFLILLVPVCLAGGQIKRRLGSSTSAA